MGTSVQIPTSITGVVYRTLQKLAKAVSELTLIKVRETGSEGPNTATTSNTSEYAIEDSFEIDTGYIPTKEERTGSLWSAKVHNVEGTFNGTSVQVGFEAIPMVSPTTTDTIKILVNLYGKNLTDYADVTFDWVLQELDK